MAITDDEKFPAAGVNYKAYFLNKDFSTFLTKLGRTHLLTTVTIF